MIDDSTNLLLYLLRICGVEIEYENFSKLYFAARAYNVVVTATIFLIVLGLLIKVFNTQYHIYIQISIFLWFTNTYVTYILVAYIIPVKFNILSVLRKLSEEESSSTCKIIAFKSKLEKKPFKKIIAFWVKFGISCCIINIVLTFLSYGINIQREFLPIGDSRGWLIIHYFLLLCNLMWIIPIILVRVSCYFVYRRIFLLVEYLEQEHIDPLDLDAVMKYYDHAYEANKLLSDCFGAMLTSNIVIPTLQISFLLQGYILRQIPSSLLAWVISTAAVLFLISSAAADLDGLNVRFRWALASVSSMDQFQSPKSMAEYRLSISKSNSMPFGVPLFGTRKRVSYNLMWTISSVILSVFFFLLGYSGG